MKTVEFLQNIGLTEKEAILYLELIKYPFLTPTEISKKTGINRTTIYPVLEQLMKKRLVKEVDGSKKTKYAAESAERIRTYFEETKSQYEEQERLLSEYVPQIKSLQNSEVDDSPVIKYYQGHKGVLDSVKDFLEIVPEKSEIRMIYSQDFVEGMFTPAESKIARGLRISKDINVKTIYSYSKGEKEESKKSDRVILEGAEKVFGDMAISDDVVRFYAGDTDVFGFIIKSKQLAGTLKKMHEIVFEYLKNKNQKRPE